MSPGERIVFESVAARLAAGAYRPRTRHPSHVPAAIVRRVRLATVCDEVLAPALSCAAVAALLALLFA